MASITIRNLDDRVKKALRVRAAENGRSLEAEARDVLTRNALAKPAKAMTGLDIFKPIRDVVEKYGGFELELPPRTPMRESDLDEPRRAGGLNEDAQPFRQPKTPGRKRK
jgi:plasmid stability protein